jgi:superfamily II DNA or RNA helicase
VPWTDYHAAWWAARLTASDFSGSAADLTRSIANARVDLNPHQVDAALFAIRSPLTRGVILADEVGLGKTIEAGLVIAQKWAERRRRILLIVPASLRTQWIGELESKFGLPVRLLDRKAQPMETGDVVLVASYQYAAGRAAAVADVPWDLVVFDEAHRLRNVYRSSSRIAGALRDATVHAPKLLLTATPLQNALIELFGLASFVDPHLFGDEASFRARFGNGTALNAANAAELRQRLNHVVTRTLRSQVREYVRFTTRIPITHDFEPSADEQRLYELVSEYLQRPDIVAIPRGQRALLTLMLRRLLASSSFAIAATLRSLLERLERGDFELPEPALGLTDDFDAFDEISEEWEPGVENDVTDPAERLAAEIEELRRFTELAEGITTNAKGDALLAALAVAFAQAERLGAQRKAVIFTESRRTQEYLVRLLNRHGFNGKVVTLNGQNTDPESRALVDEWKERNAGSTRITGSRAADTRTAIVDAFRDDTTILVATEAAAEGVNLQFCSLVVNYDLPWNPQRIEQRIGRCHRYGQQHDVVVLNLVNAANAADRRVFELLSTKFRLFEGVFGASDGVLGALESGVDVERRIASVYQTCRTADEIEAAFDALQAELEAEIADRMEATRRAVLEHFDDDVRTRLQVHRDKAQSALATHQRLLWDLARHELRGDATFSDTESRFEYRGAQADSGWYHLLWPAAEARGDHFFRSDHPLAVACIEQAATRALPVGAVSLSLGTDSAAAASLAPLRGRSGWLVCGALQVDSLQSEAHVVAAAITSTGEVLDVEQARRLLAVPAESEGVEVRPVPDALAEARVAATQDVLRAVERRNGAWYDEEVAKLDRWADDLRLSLEQQLKQLDQQIAEVRRLARLAETLGEKLELQRSLKGLEQRRNASRRELFEAQDRIIARRDDLIEAVERQLATSSAWQERFVISWALA